jgi:hypothetical protein
MNDVGFLLSETFSRTHGNTNVDSHLGLPAFLKLEELLANELVPFFKGNRTCRFDYDWSSWLVPL